MNKILSLVGLTLALTTNAMASVTPAHIAMEKVQNYLLERAQQEIFHKVQVHKFLTYPIESHLDFSRGKFSVGTGGAADYSGTLDQSFEGQNGNFSSSVHCRLFARVRVVPFAMQQVPILETVENEEQLIVEKEIVSCNL